MNPNRFDWVSGSGGTFAQLIHQDERLRIGPFEQGESCYDVRRRKIGKTQASHLKLKVPCLIPGIFIQIFSKTLNDTFICD